MQYVTLGRTGVQVSRISLGTAAFGVAPLAEDAPRLVGAALDLGINFFDTANSYGNQPRFDRAGAPPAAQRQSAEEVLGAALAGRRHEAVIGTKVMERIGPSVNDAGLSRRHVMEQAEQSLRRLRTDYIDIYHAHHPDPATTIEETIDAFDTLITDGKVRYWAISGFTAWRVVQTFWAAERSRRRAPVCHQVSYSLANRGVEQDILPVSQELGLPLTAFSPLAGGLLSGAENLERNDVGSQRWGGGAFTPAQAGLAQQLHGLAREAGFHPAQLALAWLLGRPAVASVIVGSTRPESLAVSAAATDLDVSNEMLARLDQINLA